MAKNLHRRFEHLVTIEATPEEVWEAITTSEGLTRWFPLEAKVEPGEGGSILLSWGPPWEGEAPITAWEPPSHFQWTEQVRMSNDEESRSVVVDFYLEREKNHTRVRLVQSGIGSNETWDDYLESISNGWKFELQGLRHYLENHIGRARTVIWARQRTNLAPERCAKRLFTSKKPVWEGLRPDHAPGEPVQLISLGDRSFTMDGTLLINNLPRSLVLSVANLNNSLFRYEHEKVGETGEIWFWISTYGLSRDQRDQWNKHLTQLLSGALNSAGEVK